MPEVSAKRSEFLSFQPPAISDAEIEAVSATLRSGWLTTGPRTAELEARMRDYLEAKHVLAVSSGTAALHLSLVALGVSTGAAAGRYHYVVDVLLGLIVGLAAVMVT